MNQHVRLLIWIHPQIIGLLLNCKVVSDGSLSQLVYHSTLLLLCLVHLHVLKHKINFILFLGKYIISHLFIMFICKLLLNPKLSVFLFPLNFKLSLDIFDFVFGLFIIKQLSFLNCTIILFCLISHTVHFLAFFKRFLLFFFFHLSCKLVLFSSYEATFFNNLADFFLLAIFLKLCYYSVKSFHWIENITIEPICYICWHFTFQLFDWFLVWEVFANHLVNFLIK